jgi:DNA-directed RNA polymerase III subunit RPC3
MADADTARLCVQIIHSHFGPLTAVSTSISLKQEGTRFQLKFPCHQTVASTLLIRGRLPLSQLIRFTSLKARTVRKAVLVLVQHNIIWHALTEDGEVLEVNTNECLTRLRFGRYVWQAEQLYGPAVRILIF